MVLFQLTTHLYQDLQISQTSTANILMVSASQLMDNMFGLLLNKPTVIGQDYTCDGVQSGHFEYDELLWASQQCGRNSTWFYKVVSPTTTDIEVRICRDQLRSDVGLAINTLIPFFQKNIHLLYKLKLMQ